MPADVMGYSQLLSNLASTVAAFGVLIALFKLSHDIRTQNLQSFFYLHRYLSQEEFSLARRELRTRLHKAPYTEWNEADRGYANRVCSSYDQAGILITGGIIDRRSAEVFLRSSWGESICHQYEILREYLDDAQVQPGGESIRGRDFFTHFGDLYRLACGYHRRRSWRKLFGRQ